MNSSYASFGEHHVVVDQHVVGVELAGRRAGARSARCAGSSRSRRPRGPATTSTCLRLGDRAQRLQRGLRLRGVALDESGRPRAPGRAGPGRTARRAARPPSSSWACAGRSRAAAGRARRRRRRTAARGSSPGGPGRCPSAGTASCRRRGPRRGSWSCACPAGRRPAGPPRPGGSAACWSCTSKTSAGRSTARAVGRGVDVGSRSGHLSRPLRGAADQHHAAVGTGHRALDQQQALLGVDGVDGQVLHGGARRCPCRPAMRRPLKTRPGVAQPPIEPGERCLRWVPCEAPRPWKPCRFMTPAVPLPLLRAGDVDLLAGLEDARR